MKIIKDFKNSLLKRREIKIVINAGQNPGFENALKQVSEHFKVEPGVVVVRELKSKFGRESFLIDAFIYDSVEQKEKTERKKREKKKAAEAAPAAPAGAKK